MPVPTCRIGLGGGVVALQPAALAAPRIASWVAAFPPPREPDFEITVGLIVDSTQAMPPFEPVFTYHRFDLRFDLHPDHRTAVATFDGHPDGMLAVLELALACALPAPGLLVHAAGVVIDEGVWLLPGPSGTGKSTAARAPDLERVLSDERMIVRPTDHGWRAWGTPWWSTGRTRAFDGGSAPVAGIGRIVHAERPAARPWTRPEAAAWLLGSVSLYDERPAARRAAFAGACDLVERVRCLEVDVPLEGPWSRSITTG